MSETCKVPFWGASAAADAVALWWQGEPYLRYSEFCQKASDWTSHFDAPFKPVILFYLSNVPEAVPALTGMLSANAAVLLASDELTEPVRLELQTRYDPDWIVTIEQETVVAEQQSVSRRQNDSGSNAIVHPDLSVLLSTSGSTGSPKYVRLSRDNVLSNAHAIAEVLEIHSGDLAAAHLDIHYSYGFSVMSSHLVQGAALSFSQGKFTDREFWQTMKQAPVTHLPGVPLHYQIMNRLGFARLGMPSVTTMTQAGGRLERSIRDSAHAFMDSRGGKFCVMYGQTEAAPRMSTLPHDAYPERPDSVGPALAGGRFRILDESGESVTTGEGGRIVYEGPNVMMGHAETLADLALGDTQGGVLDTGDTGFLDEQGNLTITGRSSRMGKVFGWRVNLDEIETMLEQHRRCAILQHEERVTVVLADSDASSVDEQGVLALLSEHYPLPVSAYRIVEIDSIPVSARNKTDYASLSDHLDELGSTP